MKHTLLCQTKAHRLDQACHVILYGLQKFNEILWLQLDPEVFEH